MRDSLASLTDRSRKGRWCRGYRPPPIEGPGAVNAPSRGGPGRRIGPPARLPLGWSPRAWGPSPRRTRGEWWTLWSCESGAGPPQVMGGARVRPGNLPKALELFVQLRPCIVASVEESHDAQPSASTVKEVEKPVATFSISCDDNHCQHSERLQRFQLDNAPYFP